MPGKDRSTNNEDLDDDDNDNDDGCRPGVVVPSVVLASSTFPRNGRHEGGGSSSNDSSNKRQPLTPHRRLSRSDHRLSSEMEQQQQQQRQSAQNNNNKRHQHHHHRYNAAAGAGTRTGTGTGAQKSYGAAAGGGSGSGHARNKREVVDLEKQQMKQWDERMGYSGDEEKTANLDLFKIFRYFFVLMGIWVAYEEFDDQGNVILYASNSRQIFHQMVVLIRRTYTLFVFSVMTLCTAGSFRFWIYSPPGLSLSKIECLILSVWLSNGTISLAFLIFWQIGSKLKQHGVSLSRATDQAGIKRYRLPLYMTNTIIFLILVTLIVNFNIFMAYHKVEDQLADGTKGKIAVVKLLFFDRPKSYFFVILTLIYSAFSFTGSLCIFNLACMSDAFEFKRLNHSLRQENIQASTARATTAAYLDKHAQLCNVVYDTNMTFRFYVLAQFCLLMPSFILNLYGLITLKSMATTIDMLILVSWLLICLVTLMTLTVPPAMIHSQCIKTSHIIYSKIDFHTLCYDNKIYKIVTWFVSKANVQPSGINVGCFFTLTYNFLLFMFSLIAIYLTLLPQSI